MRSRLIWRRSATAAGLYASVGLGILGTIVAARVLGLADFGLWATALAVASFFQMLLDITVEETLTKIGFRYVVQEDWGRLRRLFARCVQLKLAGGVLALVVIAALAPLADTCSTTDDSSGRVLVSACFPSSSRSRTSGSPRSCCGGRYDLRGSYQAVSGRCGWRASPSASSTASPRRWWGSSSRRLSRA